MDYYNFSPDFEDSLALLSPVAHRNTLLSNRVLIPEFIRAEDVHYMRSPITSQRNQKQLSRTHDQDKEIADQYCTESIRYRPNLHQKLTKPVLSIPKHRPLIKVIVTPNNQIGTQPNLRKRRPFAKKLHSSASDHESFFKAKNVFLFVASDKQEKVYQIKTTGSEYSTKHHSSVRYSEDEDIPVERNFKKLLSSLNMDKKKKKKGKPDKKKGKDNMAEGSAASLMDVMAGAENRKESLLRDCMFSPPIETVSPQKSRVRISGKIGLTEDHRYVMKCDATVDGKPVDSNFFQGQNRRENFSIDWEGQETREIPRVCKPCLNFGQRQQNTTVQKEIPKVYQRDEMVQCNCEQDLVAASTQYCDNYRQMCSCPAYKDISPAFRSVETQYSPPTTTVMCVPIIEQPKIFSRKDEVVQCDCGQDLVMNTNNIGIDVDFENKNSQNGCNNPLVIISVYPKQDANDKTYEEENSVIEQRGSLSTQQEKPKTKKDRKGDKKIGKRSRSPSPAKAKEDKKAEKPKGKGKVKDKGDKNKPAKGNKKGGKRDKPNQEEKKSKESKSPERRPSVSQFGITVGRCAECCIGCAGSDSKRNSDNPKEAAQFRTKRIMNWVSAKKDVSNVAINIDGENEFYDVLFRQGNITTDLQVRKTLKEAQAYKNQFDQGSLENFLPGSLDTGRKIKDDLPIADNTETLDPTIPRLSVRDSIEISHRREGKNSTDSNITDTSNSTKGSYINLGNIKHFQGDNCNLPNPVDRDREIRELLGINNLRATSSRNNQELAAKAEDDCTCSVHCFYRRQRKSNINTDINNQEQRHWLCMKNSMKQANDDVKADLIAKKNDQDDDSAIDCFVYKDTETPVVPRHESSPTIYVCDSGNKSNNRRERFKEVISISKTRSSMEPKICPKFETPGKSTFAFWFSKKQTIQKSCTPTDPSPEQCMIMKCAYDEQHETEDKLSVYLEKEQSSRLSHENKIYCKLNKLNQPSADLRHKKKPSRLISHENNTYFLIEKSIQSKCVTGESDEYKSGSPRKRKPTKLPEENPPNHPSKDLRQKESCEPCLRKHLETSAHIKHKSGIPHDRKPTDLPEENPPVPPSEHLRHKKCCLTYSRQETWACDKNKSRVPHERKATDIPEEKSPDQTSVDLRHSIVCETCNQNIRETSTRDNHKCQALERNPTDQDIEDVPDENPPLYQQLVLNRNINIFLQIEQFTKQKPIILSRKQYEKIKRVIDCSIPKNTNGISKNQSSGKICAELKRKIHDKNLKPAVSNKNTQWTYSAELNKEKKKAYFWGKKKTKTNKCPGPKTYSSKDNCASHINLFNSINEGLEESLKRSIVYDNNQQTQTNLNSQCFESVKQKLRKSSTTYKPNCEETEDYHRTNTKKYGSIFETTASIDVEINQRRINNLSENTKLEDEDLNLSKNYKGEWRKCKKTTEDNHGYEVNQSRIIKTSHNDDILLFNTDERQQSKKTMMMIKSKLGEKERKLKTNCANKKESRTLEEKESINEPSGGTEMKKNHANEIGDQFSEEKVIYTKPLGCIYREKECKKNRKNTVEEKTLKKERLLNKFIRGIHRERDNASLKYQSSQSVCCIPVVVHKDGVGSSNILSPPKTKTTDASKIKTTRDKKLHYCRHCGRLKRIHSCAICDTLNGECFHKCYCYKTEENSKSIKDIFIKDRQHAASSTEVRYTSVIYTNYKHVTFSSENVTNEDKVPVPSAANLLINDCNSNSLHTIFKGRRKTPTPNLGTSSCSVFSNYSDATSIRTQEAQPVQERKPLLRRLMSLLVMRTKISHDKIDGTKPNPKLISSSVDSYNINTSLGGIEMSSSIYDTSASFYSNHSIQPITSKACDKSVKRGFLNSFREFLLINKRT